MPRARRVKSETGIYHVILRGINKQIIFEDDEDNDMFLKTLKQYKSQSQYKLLAYCLLVQPKISSNRTSISRSL